MAGKPCVVAVDLGGTNVRAQAFDVSGHAVGLRVERPSLAKDGHEATFAAVASAVTDAAEGLQPMRVGMAVPGHIDDASGLVRWAPNFGVEEGGVFRYWEDVPLAAEISLRCGFPVSMGNDANLAALGEYTYGAGGGTASCLVLLTLGTGIGGGVVMAPSSVFGRAEGPLLLLGGNKGGAELGHMLIQRGGLDCSAGTYGALEAYCQRDAIIRRAVHKARRGRGEGILKAAGGDWSAITPKTIADAAAKGDESAIETLAEIGGCLGAAIGSLINVFAPDVFAIGGQVAKAGELILEPARREARAVAIPSLFADCRIVQSQQIDDAGLLGAAALACQLSDHAPE